MSTTKEVPTKIPSKTAIIDDSSGNLSDVADLCRDLNFMSPEKSEDVYGRDLIKADATDLTKWVAGLVGAGGALAGGFTALMAWMANDSAPALKIALVVTAGLVLVTTILVVGWVTINDVRARAGLQKERYQARKEMVSDYFGLIGEADFQDGSPGFGVIVRPPRS